MTGKERISRILRHQPADRIGIFEHFWGDTYKEYTSTGHIKHGENFDEHFGLDMGTCWAFDLTVDMDFQPVTVREDEDTVTVKDGNGALLRRHKHHDSTPEHVGFTVCEREDWEKAKPKLLEFCERRINFEAYRAAKAAAEKSGRFFCVGGVNVFECMHPICGHEHMLAGMALDPDWIADICTVYSDMIIKYWEYLFKNEGMPDGIWFYEDMGFKERPFMSPEMYKELLYPAHKKTIDWAHERSFPVLMHSCGFVEPLLPGMIEAGIDCFQTIEIKAGMDLLRIFREHGDKIALMGGIDVRALYTNDKAAIDRELESKIPIVKQGFGYIAHSDHSIPKTVDYETFRYYIDRALELGAY
jgi:uroporphyrinogen decarboxylase